MLSRTAINLPTCIRRFRQWRLAVLVFVGFLLANFGVAQAQIRRTNPAPSVAEGRAATVFLPMVTNGLANRQQLGVDFDAIVAAGENTDCAPGDLVFSQNTNVGVTLYDSRGTLRGTGEYWVTVQLDHDGRVSGNATVYIDHQPTSPVTFVFDRAETTYDRDDKLVSILFHGQRTDSNATSLVAHELTHVVQLATAPDINALCESTCCEACLVEVERQGSFNLQYLQLQDQMQHEHSYTSL